MEPRRLLANIVVNTTLPDTVTGDGLVTLREAINAANDNTATDLGDVGSSSERDRIVFAIPGAGVHTFQLAVGLPTITSPLEIDGFTQAGATPNSLANGNNANLLIEIAGEPASDGISIRSDNCLIRGLVINGWSRDPNSNVSTTEAAVRIEGSGNVVEGCFLGTDVAGTSAVPNRLGIFILVGNGNRVGGTSPAARNLISGNGEGVRQGVFAALPPLSTGNLVLGNFIGTDRTGTLPLPNGAGVRAEQGSMIIGGVDPGSRNIISGNQFSGIDLQSVFPANRAVIQGNYIGLDVTGTAPLGNGRSGITGNIPMLVGGIEPGARNVVSNNLGGIRLGGASVVQNNFVGTDASGLVAMGNKGTGIEVDFVNTIIGGTTPQAGNLIAHNGGVGVLVGRTLHANLVRLNSIFDNGGLGIDLGGDGLTHNDPGDADDGPNSLQNFPLLASADYTGGGTISVAGAFNGAANRALVLDFYGADQLEPSGAAEGRTYLGSSTITTNANGDASFSATFFTTIPVASVPFITATASTVDTAPGGETSEFSPAVSVNVVRPPAPSPPPPTLTINDVSLAEGNAGATPFTFTITRAGDLTAASTAAWATAYGPGTGGGDFPAQSGILSFAPGQATATLTVNVNGDTGVEADDVFYVDLSAPAGAALADARGVGTVLNDDVVTPTPTPTPPSGASPKIGIADASVVEGNGGTRQGLFTVTLDKPSASKVKVNFATQDATAGSGDYTAKSGTVTFAAGETSKTIAVTVKGDTKLESDETFRVNLSGASNATVLDGQAIGTIVNDDGQPVPRPVVSIGDAAASEGNNGTKLLTFTLTLSRPALAPVSVRFRTADQTAGSGDYTGVEGTVTFAAGQTTRTIVVAIKGDTKVEADETFRVDLSNPLNAALGKASGVGTIRNDD